MIVAIACIYSYVANMRQLYGTSDIFISFVIRQRTTCSCVTVLSRQRSGAQFQILPCLLTLIGLVFRNLRCVGGGGTKILPLSYLMRDDDVT